MHSFIYTLALVFFCSLATLAQKPFSSGLEFDDEEYENLPHTSENIKIQSGQKALVSSIDLSSYCPEIRHQGDISSCVGWSLGYGAMTIERAIQNDWKDKKTISENANSALFVYNQISAGNCDLGISMPKAMELVQNKGNCLARDFDFDINDCSKSVSNQLLEKAQAYQVADYVPLFRSTALAEEKVRMTKLVLAQMKPVVVGMTVLNNFYQIRPGDKSWLPGIGDKTYAGGHAMVVVGYDDNKFASPMRVVPDNVKGAFKLMNSWGKNWGERGYIWVRYADFGNYCKQAFALMLRDAEPINFDFDKEIAQEENLKEKESEELLGRELSQFAGVFGFRNYVGWDNGPQFEEATVRLNQAGYYRLEGDWQVGNKFQLYVESGFEGGYIYVFSIDPRGKAAIHFPRSQEYDQQFEGQNQSALVWEGGSVLTIPTEKSALALSHQGEDRLVALFSLNKIKAEYLKLLALELAKDKENIPGLLSDILGAYMVPFSDIAFEPGKMGFEVSTRSNGKIVPIILEVSVN